jgi:serine/threonine-protein kinase
MSRAVDPLIGAVIAGRYEVVRIIGKGGMGTIYEVKNTRLGRSFALKTLSDGSQDAELLARFRREAEIVAKLTHPNILDVVDWDTLEDGSPCMIMEYLRGEDLSTRLRTHGPLSWPDFARIADQVLAALTVAHRAGIVHRDLKPQNIFLAADDNGDERVKLLDFGISKLRDARTFTTTDAKVMGTPAYMPPEQAEGRQEDIGPATDVWAMATILYEMATSKVAFEAPSIPAVLYRVCHGRPKPVKEVRADTPDGLVQLIENALVVDVHARIDSIERMRIDLRSAMSHLDGVSWAEPLRARGAMATPSSAAPLVRKNVENDPLATAPTLGVGHEATLMPSPAAPPPVAAIATRPAPVGAPTQVATKPAKPWLVPVTLAGLLLAGVVGFIAMRSPHDGVSAKPEPASPIATERTPSPAPAPTPTPTPTPTPAPPERPTTVHVAINSKPDGADIYRMPSEAKVGVTPWTSDLDRTEGTAVFVLKKKGYTDGRVEIDLRSGGEPPLVELAKLVTTAKVKPTRPETTTTTTVTPTQQTNRKKGDPVDPFAPRK